MITWYPFRENTEKLYIESGTVNATIDAMVDESKRYDYVVVDDCFHILAKRLQLEPAALIRWLNGLLAEEGVLLLLVPNRMGLRYFCGATDPYEPVWFKGIRGYAPTDENQTYSKAQWEAFLSRVGLESYRFLYPYPDHLHTEEVFSDATIDSMGYGADYDNYDANRLLLFEEPLAAEGLAKEKVLKHFSNSFCIEISGNSNNLSSLTYVKLNYDRKEEFRIGTRIEMTEEGERICKYPLSPLAQRHIEQIDINDRATCHAGIRCWSGSYRNRMIEYSFLQGANLEEMLLQTVEGGERERFDKYFEDFFRLILDGAHPCDDFDSASLKAYFGEASLTGAFACVNPANIDLIPENVYFYDDSVYTIDNEWILYQEVPVHFIIWRSLSDFYEKHPSAERLHPLSELFQHYFISEEERAVYRKWNIYFTEEYVGAGKAKGLSFEKKLPPFQKWQPRMEGIIYLDRGKGFTEEDTIRMTTHREDNRFSYSCTLPNSEEIKAIRFDPVGGFACECEVSLKCGEKVFRLKAANADLTRENHDFFYHDDPQYLFKPDNVTSSDIELFGYLRPMDDKELFDRIRQLNAELNSSHKSGFRKLKGVFGGHGRGEKKDNTQNE